jgi:hypothetical protein
MNDQDQTKTEGWGAVASSDLLGGGETTQAKYKRLKDQIRAGVMLAREDFLFVKAIDHRSNTQRALRRYRRPRFIGGPVVYGGYNTAKR